MTAEEEFASRLSGVSAQEFANLMANIIRKPNQTLSTSNAGKRVRKWVANLLGIKISVTEIDMAPTRIKNYFKNYYFLFASAIEYVIETMEWEIRVKIGSGDIADENSYCLVRIGTFSGKMSMPIFEGDFDTFKAEMSLIRLMCLENDNPEEVALC
jgi:hypothetical protein